jgi:hypothetical protein
MTKQRPQNEWWEVKVKGGSLDGQTLKREFFGAQLRNFIDFNEEGTVREIYDYSLSDFKAHTATATYFETITTPWAGTPKPTKQYFYKELGEDSITPCTEAEADPAPTE